MHVPPYFDYYKVKEAMQALIDHIKGVTDYASHISNQLTVSQADIQQLGKEVAQLKQFKQFAENTLPGINDAFVAANKLDSFIHKGE